MSDNGGYEPTIESIHEVKMYNPDTDEDEPLEKVDFTGSDDIYKHDEVEALRDEDWIVRGFSANVGYKGYVYEVTVAGNSVMGYITIKDIQKFDDGRELQRKLRKRFLKHFPRNN